jgi:succinoglycan biosynthesis transport protein ExoP
MKLDPRIGDLASRPAAGPDGPAQLQTLRDLLTRIWRGRATIALATLLFAALAVLAASRMPDHYRAAASVMFAAQELNIVDLGAILTDPAFSNDTLQNEIEVLRSTSLLQRVADQLGLAENPELNPDLAAPGTFARLRATLPFMVDPEPLSEADAARRSRLVVLDRLLERLVLTPIEGTRVIEIAFTSLSPETSAAIVNAIAEQYLVDQLVARAETTRSAIDWLSVRVDEARVQVRAAEDAVERLRAELAEEAGQGLEITRQQLVALTAALSEAQRRTTATEDRHARLEAALRDGLDVATVPEFREAPRIAAYRAEEDALAARLDGLSRNHPAARQARADLAALRDSIRREAEDIVAAVGIDLQAARANETSLTVAVRALESKSLGQSREEIRLRQLERDADASRLIHETMLKRLKEASEQVDLQEANARVLSPADPPLGPESSRKQLVVAMAATLGAIAGTGLVFLLDHLSTTFRTAQDAAQATRLPVLASVPAVGSRAGRGDLVRLLRERPSSRLAESIRNLRTSLLFANLDRPPRVVLFTSSLPEEGKSTTAMLLALTSRQMGRSTIIVDCDLRQPAAGLTLGADHVRFGLLSILEGSATLEEAIHVDPDSGLHVLGSGRAGAPTLTSPADLLASGRFAELVRVLEDRYDLVILDAPPALVLADARILSSLCDAVVYAVRWDSTPRDAVLDGLAELAAIDAPVAGLVLTMLNESRAARYASAGYGTYRRRFGRYGLD